MQVGECKQASSNEFFGGLADEIIKNKVEVHVKHQDVSATSGAGAAVEEDADGVTAILWQMLPFKKCGKRQDQ
jgi:hypothetical protein